MIQSEHFHALELCCPHCGRCEVTQALLDALEAFRAAVGQPVLIDSAYRCPEHNAAVGGVPNSQHVLGEAADVRVAEMTGWQLYDVAVKIPLIHGFGVDFHKNYLHIDVRTPASAGHVAKWTYLPSGGPGPWQEPPSEVEA